MNEKDFMKLVEDTVRVESYEHKERLSELLRIASLTFQKTNEFTYHLWNHYKEYIIISIIPDNLIELRKHKEYLEKVCSEIYISNDEYEFCGIEIRPGMLSEHEDVSQEIVFERIRNEIIEEIRQAKYVIWIVMAWFTDPMLFNELIKKKAQGVTIEIILDENKTNRDASFDLGEHFPTHWILLESYYKNTMHEKFCVIDLKTVIHGSFNWSKSANYNKEHISIDRNHATAEAFADEFMRLKNGK